MRKILIMVVLLVALSGCLKQETTEPNSGKVITTYQIDSNSAAKLEATATQAQAIAATVAAAAIPLAPVFPWAPVAGGIATTIAGILGAALGTWAKIKPKLIEAQTKQQIYYNATSSVVTAIESYKTAYPDQWTSLEAQLIKAIGPEAENVIRALRGLPAKT